MIYDTFMYCGEIDVLKLRLMELDPIVDRFIILEGDKTHTREQKGFLFKEQQDEIKKFHHKIIYLPASYCKSENPFYNDFFGREIIQRALLEEIGLKEDDIVLHGDLDEIPDISVLKENLNSIPSTLIMKFRLLCIDLESNQTSPGTMILNKSVLTKFPLHYLRSNKQNQKDDVTFRQIQNGGWHFSYSGGPKNVIKKLNAYAHAAECPEHVKSEEFILNCIQNSTDLTKGELKRVSLDSDDFPKALLQNKSEFVNLLSSNYI